eukprot:COSAG05_NODE_12836_length_452_cov_1.019830_2_plen_45_part_01
MGGCDSRLGKGKEVPEYLQWEGTARNAHFTRAESEALVVEIFDST